MHLIDQELTAHLLNLEAGFGDHVAGRAFGEAISRIKILSDKLTEGEWISPGKMIPTTFDLVWALADRDSEPEIATYYNGAWIAYRTRTPMEKVCLWARIIPREMPVKKGA